tara:strand:- start:1024 stop:1743 length:720 start_codon:yes stop_codon:yes gene_type:complete
MEWRPYRPETLGGWLEGKLDQKEVDYVWKCIKEAEDNNVDKRSELAGNISSSLQLIDVDNYFERQVLVPLCHSYLKCFPEYKLAKTSLPYSPNTDIADIEWSDIGWNFSLSSWWVNKQKQYEYNPPHDHAGQFSFALWLKEPAEWDEQKQKTNSVKTNNPVNNTFQFSFNDILGNRQCFTYQLGKHVENMIVFFPASLQHGVYPFFDNEGIRISVAGNIFMQARLLSDLEDGEKIDLSP